MGLGSEFTLRFPAARAEVAPAPGAAVRTRDPSDAGDDTVIYSDEVVEPLPSVDLEFGDLLPLVPVTSAPSAIATVSIGG